MEKYIYDESTGLWCGLQGDYYIPWLNLPDEEQVKSAYGVNGVCSISNIAEMAAIFRWFLTANLIATLLT